MSTDYENEMKDAERGRVALEATWGIDALAILAINALDDELHGEVVWATREVLKRIKHLNSVIMSAVGDENESTEELKARVN